MTGALLFAGGVLRAQKGSVKGFVYDQTDGEGVPYATVRVEGTETGAACDEHGFFYIPNLTEGRYTLSVSYLGYARKTIEVEVKRGTTTNVKIYIEPQDVQLSDVEVSAEKQQSRTETRVSVTSVTSVDIKRMPTIGGEPDIAQYLQVLPGIISTGDQGGQLVIRGGTPVQTRFLLDGITVYNPFHSIGLFSVYETDLIKNVDVYTGGYPAPYGNRISAVVDVTTRDGNRKKLSGKLSASPFLAHALLEVPVVKMREDRNTSASLVLNTKVSYLNQTSKALYRYAGNEGLPFSFYDFFGKFSVSAGQGNKFNITGFNFRDLAAYRAVRYAWNTFGVGANFLAVPRNSNLYFNTHVNYSQYEIGMSGAEYPENRSMIGGFDIGMDFVYYIRQGELKYGINVEGTQTQLLLTNQFMQRYEQNQNTTDMGLYLHFHKYGKRFVVEAGARLQYFGKISSLSPEPRLSVKYNATDFLRLKFASGMYAQNFISSKSDRDIVNLFTGFITGTSEAPGDATGKLYDNIRNMQRSVHAIAGAELELPANVKLNIEPYYKYFWRLLNINRFKQFNTDPNFIIETGHAYGTDLMARWEWKGLYLYGAYSLAWVTRNDGVQTYPPHFDRRHNTNLMAVYTFGKKKDYEVSVRWNFGSGFPFTKTLSFFENIDFADGIGTDYTTENGTLGILYDRIINGGRLPTYHRLDAGFKKIFTIKNAVKIELNANVTNAYNRNNIFYFDRVRYTRINQLPVMPSLSVGVSF